ncbi:MAG: acireductone synthase [Cyanobacteria bacterium]|nr:acireductone synthase [Cyanobacteriota bacterium]MDA1020505.1 acireductone synthase [Cyanobacteriota bacterium]
MSSIKVILTDIEGTTSSISFVKDILFPYAYEKLEGFVEANKEDPEVQRILKEVGKDPIQTLKHWIKLDLKNKALKDLQGLIWEKGYKDGDYQGHIYDDAYSFLVKWHEQGIKLYIYSSGSVYAQKLLFGHTKHGDLNNLFTGNFDTSVGNKREAKSYINIYEAIFKKTPQLEPAEILFLSDIQEELDAAQDAGLKTQLITREDGIDFNIIKLT